jgi:tellurite resistance protein TerA
MTVLTMGGNSPLPGDDFEVSVRWKLNSAAIDEIDVSAFILNSGGKVTSDDDMVFYGQRSHPSGAVRLVETRRQAPGGAAEASFDFDLRRLSPSSEKIAVTGTISEAQRKKVSFKDVSSLVVSVSRAGGAQITFDVPVSGMSEAALILGEFYRRNGQWKFRAVGQGYNGGLKPLAEGFGVKVDDDPAPATPSPVPPTTSVPPVAPPSTPVSLSKVTLTKERPAISLAKKGDSFGEIKVNLNWNKRAKAGGGLLGGMFGGGRDKGIDLDLGCLYELRDGSKGVVQALGNAFGDFERAPFIRLMSDDRTGASADGEWMRINGLRWNDIRRIMIYTFIYDGVANWAETDGIVTVYVPGNGPIEVKLGEGASDRRSCGIALLENVGGEISVKREVRYFGNVSEIDRAYGWGLRWSAGSK